ncbi:MAG: DUF3887 domain-containing protein [Phycisphaerae bacterium]|nr:DUF3887 domain-containing protein [Phycisphaerae bacterium]MDD5381294.1 DUF3887 domain-containing protein [Phycisphaerae bacterium]
MPVGQRQQNNAMLYTVITFVGLFIISTVVAVIFYLQAEKHRTAEAALQSQMDEMASKAELSKIGAIVGAKQSRKSRLGTMVDYLDGTMSMIVGGLPEDTSAEVKFDTADRKVKDILESLTQQRLAVEPNVPVAESVEPNTPTNELVELLAAQQFSVVTEDFNEAVKNALPPEKLEEVWKATIEQMGPFQKQLGSMTETEADSNVVSVTCQFENGVLDVRIAYNADKQVASLSIVPTPAEVMESYQQALQPAQPEKPEDFERRQQAYIEIDDPNIVGLVGVVEKLKAKLDGTTNTALFFQDQFDKLKNRFDDAIRVGLEKEQTLLAEKEKYQMQVDEIKKDYNDLKVMLQQTSDQQVQTLMTQLEEERDNRKKLSQQLLKTEAELTTAEERIKRALEKLHALVPSPDSEIAAYKPDGKIILVDDAAKVVHINLGSDDHVYRGLTFSVYEKNTPILREGKGKAEIEVFNVGKNISTARIVSSTKNPIIMDDAIANLVWDSDKTNTFVVAGEFDLNGDGNIDYEGADKIKALIQKWGGRVADEITIDTDFLVLGTIPTILKKPTFEQMEVDPTAMEKYEASLKRLTSYKEIQERAQKLSMPVFNLERFLYFIGYKTLSARPDAF